MPLFLKADGTKLPLGCNNSHKQIKFKNFQLTTKSPDNCCYLKDRSVFCIRYIGFMNEVPVILGNRYNELCPIATYPCNSQDMNIHVSNGQTQDLEMYYVIFCEDWCSVVPELWIDMKNKTFRWPPKEIKFATAIQKGFLPNDSWIRQSYRHVIGPYDTYETARHMEKRQNLFPLQKMIN